MQPDYLIHGEHGEAERESVPVTQETLRALARSASDGEEQYRRDEEQDRREPRGEALFLIDIEEVGEKPGQLMNPVVEALEREMSYDQPENDPREEPR